MLHGAEIKVMLTAAFKEAYLELVPEFERTTGNTVTSLWVTSVDMMMRLKAGEVIDFAILAAKAADELAAAGIVGERAVLATCGVAAAVRTGAPKPDLSSAEALKRAVLAAKGIVYSRGPSGVYLKGLFERMGIADTIASKVTICHGEPAGAVVARGDAELGFQQMSELLPVPGIDIVGPLPPDIQEITTFVAALHKRAPQAEAARALIEHFTSPQAAPVIRRKGMDPAKAQGD